MLSLMSQMKQGVLGYKSRRIPEPQWALGTSQLFALVFVVPELHRGVWGGPDHPNGSRLRTCQCLIRALKPRTDVCSLRVCSPAPVALVVMLGPSESLETVCVGHVYFMELKVGQASLHSSTSSAPIEAGNSVKRLHTVANSRHL